MLKEIANRVRNRVWNQPDQRILGVLIKHYTELTKINLIEYNEKNVIYPCNS